MSVVRAKPGIVIILLAGMISVVLLVSAAIVIGTTIVAKRGYTTQLLQDVDALSQSYQGYILELLEGNAKRVVDFSSDGLIRTSAADIIAGKSDVVPSLNDHLRNNKQSLDTTIVGINILDRSFRVIASTDGSEIGKTLSDEGIFTNLISQPYGASEVDDVLQSSAFGSSKPLFVAAAPLMNIDKTQLLGIIVNYIHLDVLNDLISGKRQQDLGAAPSDFNRSALTVYIVNSEGLMIAPPPHLGQTSVLTQRVDTLPVQQCIQGGATSGLYIDYDGNEVVGSSRCLPQGWTLLVEMKQSEAFAAFTSAQRQSILIALLLFLCSLFPIILLIRRISVPLVSLRSVADAITSGNLAVQADEEAAGEIGNLARTFNLMVQKLRETQQSISSQVEKRTAELRGALEKQKTTTGAMLNLMEDVEKAKKSQEAATLRLKLAADSAGIGIWEWDIVRNALVWDEQMYQLYGIKRSDFSGAYDAWQKGLHPDDKKRGDDEIQLALQGKKNFDTEFRVLWPDQSVHYLRAFGMVLRDSAGVPMKMIGVNFDQTKEHDSIEEIKRFKLAVESSTTPINILSAQQKFIYVNPAWERLTGFSASEVLGKTPEILNVSESDPALLEQLGAAFQGGTFFHTEELIGRHKNGTLQNIELTLFPVMDGDTLVNIVGFSQDISDRKRSEKAKSEFISLASHQLRTPLTAIKWIISTLQSGKTGPLTETQKDMLTDAEKSSIHMAETIGTMLSISRIEAAKMTLQVTEVNAAQLAKDILAEQKPVYEKKQQVALLDAPVDCVFHTDKKILTEVIANLISNAVKYTPEKGKITLAMHASDTNVIFTVSDTGYGIPSKEQARVFSKFFRAENVTSKQTEGTGLGLYLVHSLVLILGGTITFVSEENKGTTFTVTLPLTPSLHAENSDR